MVGNDRMLEERGIALGEARGTITLLMNEGKTVSLLSDEGRLLGVLAIYSYRYVLRSFTLLVRSHSRP